MAFRPGDQVHVAAFGRGQVREVRNGGRYLVEVKGRAMLVEAGQLTPAGPAKHSPPRTAGSTDLPEFPTRAHAPAALDLHGFTAAEAVTALDQFLDDAILAGLAEVRVIHGRSGGRLKAAVHQRLRLLSSVRSFHVDPANAGVTVVTF